jgi:TonB-dependent SusC/RagA subfamily outer membrane receptor
MKRSFIFSSLLPTALALGLSVGCAHGRNAMVQGSPQRRSAALTAEDIERSPAVPVEQLLVAKVPGLMLTRGQDGRTVIHIRGMTSLLDDGEPLYVVNGIALGDAGNIWAINRYDIASVEVLKDPATTSAWGIRGSNGVIVIKTKGS